LRQRLKHRRVKLLLDFASYDGSPRGMMSIPIIIPRTDSGLRTRRRTTAALCRKGISNWFPRRNT
ncbi:MAG: hypothetical protein ACM3N3_10550, partial [Betaproteobacteria bacterium]